MSTGDWRASKPKSSTSEGNWMRCVSFFNMLALTHHIPSMNLTTLNNMTSANQSLGRVSLLANMKVTAVWGFKTPLPMETAKPAKCPCQSYLQMDYQLIHTTILTMGLPV